MLLHNLLILEDVFILSLCFHCCLGLMMTRPRFVGAEGTVLVANVSEGSPHSGLLHNKLAPYVLHTTSCWWFEMETDACVHCGCSVTCHMFALQHATSVAIPCTNQETCTTDSAAHCPPPCAQRMLEVLCRSSARGITWCSSRSCHARPSLRPLAASPAVVAISLQWFHV